MSIVEQVELKPRLESSVALTDLGRKVSDLGYHEMPERKSQVDVLEQLHANIKTLTDLNDRMCFMMKEVQSLIRR